MQDLGLAHAMDDAKMIEVQSVVSEGCKALKEAVRSPR